MNAARRIAANVRSLRRAAGWQQQEAAARLAQAGGPTWTVAAWSAMERSAVTDRVRAFTADEIEALADLFGVAVGDLFGDPSMVKCPHCDGTGEVPA